MGIQSNYIETDGRSGQPSASSARLQSRHARGSLR